MKAKFKLSSFTIVCLVLYIISFMLILPNSLHASYVKQVNDSGNNSATIADFVFLVENENDSYAVNLANKIKKPGDSASYSFVIKNYDGKLSELPIEYQIDLELIGNIPIQCVLYQESVSKFAISTLDQQKNTCTGVMDITETEVHFEITIEWPSDKIDSSYYEQDAIAAVFLTIQATQID